MIKGLLGTHSKENTSEETITLSIEQEKQMISGIIDDTITFSSEEPVQYLSVSISQLESLQDLPSFKEYSHIHKQAHKFASRYEGSVEIFVQLVNTDDEFSLSLHTVDYTGKLSNEAVKDFCQTFRTDIHSTFDIESDDPTMTIYPH